MMCCCQFGALHSRRIMSNHSHSHPILARINRLHALKKLNYMLIFLSLRQLENCGLSGPMIHNRFHQHIFTVFFYATRMHFQSLRILFLSFCVPLFILFDMKNPVRKRLKIDIFSRNVSFIRNYGAIFHWFHHFLPLPLTLAGWLPPLIYVS